MKFTDKEIATLLNEVSESLVKSEKAMKKSLRKDVPEMDQAPVENEAPEAAPEMDAAPEQAPMDAAPEMQNDAPVEGDEAIADEGDQPLTDEELTQVYSAMEPEEIERHFMIIREILQGIYGNEGEEQVEGEGQEQAPQMDQAPEAAPEMDAAPEMGQEDEQAFKSENKILKSEVAALKAGLGNLAKAMEAMAPTRKSFTGILHKSEDTSVATLSKSDITAKINEISRKPNLTKSERNTINTYCLTGVGADEVMKLITNHGGK
jgi:hypothetical protein